VSLILQFCLSLTASNDTAPVRMVRFFSFFTIESNIVVCVAAASLVLAADRDGPLWRVTRLDSVLCITVTGLVYVTVLRNVVRVSGWDAVANAGLHYVTPIAVVLGWLFFGPRPRCSFATLGYAAIFPIAWLAYTLGRGAIVHWYPYPFVDVVTHGYTRVTVNCLVVSVLILAVGALVVVLDRRLPAAPGRSPS
jgi:hypothetical protein